MRIQAVDRRFTDRARPRRQMSDLVAATLAGLAGALHLWLTPAHAAEGALFGGVFLGIALFQLGIAAALALAPGPLVRGVGRWGSLAVVVIFLGVRVVPPPGGHGTPEPLAGPTGLVSLLLELGALAALAVLLTPRPGARGGAPRWPAAAVAGAYVVLQIIAAGGVVYARKPFAEVFYAEWRVFENAPLSGSPALHLLIGHRWSINLPLAPTALTVVVGGVLGVAVGLTIQLARVRAGCDARLGLLGVLPASLSAPVCCAPSLLSSAGVALPGLLGFLALPLLALSGLLLLADVVWLRRQLRRLDAAGGDALPARDEGPIRGPRGMAGGGG